MSTDRSIQGADPVQNADLSPDELDAVAGGGGNHGFQNDRFHKSEPFSAVRYE
jgi:hypothetical protein